MDKDQDSAASAPDGGLPPLGHSYLVLAGPGTGKTTLLVERVRQFLESPLGRTQRALALTFTNKAAGEMKARLGAAVPDLEDRVFIGTFHRFAHHVLRAHGQAIGIAKDFVVYDEKDQRVLLTQLQERGDVSTGVDIESLVYAFSRLKSRGRLRRSDSEPEGISEQLNEIHGVYARAMRAAHALDFGDLILECSRLLSEKPAIRKIYRTAYRHVVVDECQDTTPAQFELLRELVDPSLQEMFAVADEDQLIFEWNEARAETLNRVSDEFRAAIFYYTLSHRCPRNIVEAANAVIRNNRARFAGKPEISAARETEYPIWLYEASDEQAEAEFVAASIRDLLAGGTRAKDVVVVARARRLLDQVEEELEGVGVPAARPTLGGLGGSEEAEVVLRLLRWLQNARDEQSARQVLQFVCPSGLGEFETGLQQAREQGVSFSAAMLPDSSDAKLKGVLESVELWRRLIGDTRRLLDELKRDLPQWLEGESEERREEVQRVLGELVSVRAQVSVKMRLPLPEFLLSLPQSVGGGREAGKVQGAVSLLTYHQAKGLEFGVVFLVALEDGVFPDFRSAKDQRRLEEERRLFYVGITRTKSRLYLTCARRRRTAGGYERPRERSRFISEIPTQLVKTVTQE